MKELLSPYEKAHLIVAFVRVSIYQTNTPPEIGDIAKALNISTDALGQICRQLVQINALIAIDNPFGTRYGIGDITKIEALSKTIEDSKDALQEALQQFQQNRSQLTQKTMESVKALKQKKETLFKELSEKLKGNPKS